MRAMIASPPRAISPTSDLKSRGGNLAHAKVGGVTLVPAKRGKGSGKKVEAPHRPPGGEETMAVRQAGAVGNALITSRVFNGGGGGPWSSVSGS